MQSKNRSIIKELIKDAKNSNIDKERMHELLCFLNLIRELNFDGTTILSLRNIEIKDGNLQSIAEFDGVSINISKNVIKIIIIEAKSGKASSTKALNELLSKITKLKLQEYKIPKKTRKRKNGYAYSILRLN